jgi:hypothetical protein
VRIAQTNNLNKIAFWKFYRRNILGDVDTTGRITLKLVAGNLVKLFIDLKRMSAAHTM